MPLPFQMKLTPATDKEKRVLANRYQIEKKLGSGNCGTAWLVVDLKAVDSQQKMKVVKEIPVGEMNPDETIDAMREASLLRNLDHPNIVKFYDSFIDEHFYLVTEYCEGGDLSDKISEQKNSLQAFPEEQITQWMIQILLALQYMHDRRIMHRDLKSRNIFLKANQVKIGDFGISKILMGTTDMASTFVGTPYYMSPEVLKHNGYNSKSDIWSVGCILFELVTFKRAFEGSNLMEVMYKIVENDAPQWPEGSYSMDLRSLFESLMIKDPMERQSASELLKTSYIKGKMEKLALSIEIQQRQSARVFPAGPERKEKETNNRDQQNFEHLSHKERIISNKKRESDRKAMEIRAAALQQLVDNDLMYQNNRQRFDPYYSSLANDGMKQPEKLVVQQKFEYEVKNVGSELRKSKSFSEKKTSSDHNIDENTVLPLRTYPRRSVPDERPITPLQDRMVYDVKHSSLDFRDGIPENPELADTFYSQFEDFDTDDNLENTIISEEDDFAACMRAALQRCNESEDSQVVIENSENDPYGPAARDAKIQHLKLEAIKLLGAENFNIVYNALKAEVGKQTFFEVKKKFHYCIKKESDYEVIEKLLFLEAQSQLALNS